MTDYAVLDTDELARTIAKGTDSLVTVLDSLDLAAPHLVDRDALVVTLMDLRDIKVRVAEVYATYEAQLLSEAGEKSFLTPLGKVEVRKQTRRSKWDWDRLFPTLVRKAREELRLNGETGEVESEGEAVARVIRDSVSFSQAKVTGLRARGLDPDEWSQVDAEVWSVQLPPRTV